ncbi:PIN domain-containing protein [Kutzneria buriramensis]|uniref:PIN like domain-containing protein n=1 Tax=Kutzneria buriramensis TaxID=1045776 RepID=A0A3E0GSJ9_9PSEU|nr:PIN domain-containing protein [Kutzneria buriramensis]REH25976.1 hypothetical protein BCF44_13515 [Kutzneria buriramensis]
MENSAGKQLNTPPRLGLFDGFEAYLTADDNKYLDLFNSGLIVLDTNAIHNLYRYAEQTRHDFITALRAVKEQLWVPHQVLIEFWRNRDSVMRDKTASPQDIIDYANESYVAVCEKIDKWAKRISLEEAKQDGLKQEFRASVDRLITSLQFHGNEELHSVSDTNSDPVLSDLSGLLHGRIGAPISREDRDDAKGEAERRIAAMQPPAYKDSKKPVDEAIGDYLIWHEMLEEAKRRQVDVLFITGDVKEDWWRIDGGRTRGPRVELFDEMKSKAGVALYMLRPESFLHHIRRLLKVEVEPNSIREVELIDERTAATVFRVGGDAILRDSQLFDPFEGGRNSLDGYVSFLKDQGAKVFFDFALEDSPEVEARLVSYREKQFIVGHIGPGSDTRQAYSTVKILRQAANRLYNADEVELVLVTPSPSRPVSAVIVNESGAVPVWRSGSRWWSIRRGVDKGLAQEALRLSTNVVARGREELARISSGEDYATKGLDNDLDI